MQEVWKIFMTKKDSHLDYVCPVCFNQIDYCTCDSGSWYAIQIDRNIQEHIRILNTKGYKTQYCCESHKPCENMYVAFDGDYGFGSAIELPYGFKKHFNGVSWMCEINTAMEDYVAQKEKQLGILLEWCKSLPDIDKTT